MSSSYILRTRTLSLSDLCHPSLYVTSNVTFCIYILSLSLTIAYTHREEAVKMRCRVRTRQSATEFLQRRTRRGRRKGEYMHWTRTCATVQSADAVRNENTGQDEEGEDSEVVALLREFWMLRGVRDEARLDVLGRLRQREGGEMIREDDIHTNVLPLASAWRASGLNSPQKINERYIKLVQLLGFGAKSAASSTRSEKDFLDVNFLVLREPGLLCVEPSMLASRLVRLASSKEAEDVGLKRLIEKEPSLLTNDASDGNWERMLAECQQYRTENGDINVPERLRLLSGSAASTSSSSALSATAVNELSSWLTAQRKLHARGELECGRVSALDALGMEWSADDAEWSVMFSEFKKYREAHGHNELMPYNNSSSGSVDAGLLWHWASIQRVSARNKVLSSTRQSALESVDFDFSGVDAAHA